MVADNIIIIIYIIIIFIDSMPNIGENLNAQYPNWNILSCI